MHVYQFGFTYVDRRILWPVCDALERRGHRVVRHDLWNGSAHDQSMEPTWWKSYISGKRDDRVVLTTADLVQPEGHRVQVARIAEARERGIPTVAVQHGAYDWPFPPMAADIDCLWGPYYARLVTDARDVRLAGNPAYDDWPDAGAARAVVSERLGVNVRGGYALFAAISEQVMKTGEPRLRGTSTALFEEAIRAATACLPVILRPHPRERGGAFYQRMAEHPGVHVWPGDTERAPESALTAGASLVIGNSSILVDAAVNGIPVVWAVEETHPATDNIISFSWDGPDVIQWALEHGEPSPGFVMEHNTNPPGYAAERIADAVAGAAERQQTGEVIYDYRV